MAKAAIDLFTWATPNGKKISIALEELELPYNVHAINISKNEQFSPEFISKNPNSKIPCIVDHDGPDGKPITVFESGAILLYLAEKTGKLLPKDLRGKAEVTQWVMWNMGGVGPMFGQYNHFNRFAKEKIPYAIERYKTEATRLVKVLDTQLGTTTGYVCSTGFSIADIITYPWVQIVATPYSPLNVEEFPNVQKWLALIASRPAVQKGMAIPDTSKL